MDAFLVEVNKKSISDKIRKSRQEKKVVKELISACKSVTFETEYQKILYNQKVKQELRQKLFFTKVDDDKINKAFNIQISELSLKAILMGSSEVMAQNIVDLFRIAMKLRRKKILCWYCYYKVYEDRVRDVKSKNDTSSYE
ncbi:unnamed protein product [Rhizophagus irregularis]|nr:unnamed protein product [Rhizophagus irregularis]